MGSPKALLKIGEETFVECIVRKAKEAGIQSILLITGKDPIVPPQGVFAVKNEDYRRGQISSVQKGIQQVQSGAILVWPVDQPLIQAETLRKLLGSYQREQKNLTIPVYQSKKGHPVIYSRTAMEAALRLLPDETGKDLQSQFATSTHFVEVEDPAILIDIDTREDYSRHISNV